MSLRFQTVLFQQYSANHSQVYLTREVVAAGVPEDVDGYPMVVIVEPEAPRACKSIAISYLNVEIRSRILFANDFYLYVEIRNRFSFISCFCSFRPQR